jgi:hypothetical protein
MNIPTLATTNNLKKWIFAHKEITSIFVGIGAVISLLVYPEALIMASLAGVISVVTWLVIDTFMGK